MPERGNLYGDRASARPCRASTFAGIAAALGPGRRGVLITPSGKRHRVLLEADGALFLFSYRSRRWGQRLHGDADLPREWRSQGVIVRPLPSREIRRIAVLRRVATAVLRYTPEDVWPELKADAIVLLAAMDDLAGAAAKGVPALAAAFEGLRLQALPFHARITTLRVQGAGEEQARQALSAFQRRETFEISWRGKYDCAAWGRRSPDGHYRACLATEYRGTGNGHYWALLDGTHALYLESD